MRDSSIFCKKTAYAFQQAVAAASVRRAASRVAAGVCRHTMLFLKNRCARGSSRRQRSSAIGRQSRVRSPALEPRVCHEKSSAVPCHHAALCGARFQGLSFNARNQRRFGIRPGACSFQRRCSNNLNQVAVQANTYGGIYPQEIKSCKKTMPTYGAAVRAAGEAGRHRAAP